MELKPILLATLISGGCLVAASPSFAASPGYAHDSSGMVVHDGRGNCVRTSDWTPKSATTECDSELLPPPVAAAPPPAPPVAEIAAIEPRKPISVNEKAQFGLNEAILKAEDKQRLDEAFSQIQNLPEGATVQITGYTDSTGSEQYNQDLSMRRAQAAQEYLVSKGVDQKRIVLSGMGESNPIASNDTAEGRAQNRRVEVKAESK